MDIGQKLTLGLEVTALGLLVVFTCLILLIVVTLLLAKIARERKKPQLEKTEVLAVQETQEEQYSIDDDKELVAVLSAAVYAYLENEDGENDDKTYKIKSFKRVNNKSAWGNAGKRAQIFNKF